MVSFIAQAVFALVGFLATACTKKDESPPLSSKTVDEYISHRRSVCSGEFVNEDRSIRVVQYLDGWLYGLYDGKLHQKNSLVDKRSQSLPVPGLDVYFSKSDADNCDVLDGVIGRLTVIKREFPQLNVRIFEIPDDFAPAAKDDAYHDALDEGRRAVFIQTRDGLLPTKKI